jgi:hypothetical protein
MEMTETLLVRKHIIQKSTDTDTSAPGEGKFLAVVSLVLWAGAVFSGRFLAYTYKYLDASFDTRTF